MRSQIFSEKKKNKHLEGEPKQTCEDREREMKPMFRLSLPSSIGVVSRIRRDRLRDLMLRGGREIKVSKQRRVASAANVSGEVVRVRLRNKRHQREEVWV